MPSQMMVTLKGVAESMVALMTMLLQILISQLEVSNNAEMLDESNENNPEMRQTLENMVQELQNHRNILQGIMANQQAIQNQASRPITGQPSGSSQATVPGGTSAHRGQATRHPRALPNVSLQASNLQPTGPQCIESTRNDSDFNMGVGRGGGIHRGTYQCDEHPNVDHCDARDTGSNQASFHHRVGTTSDLMGKEAQGEDLVGDVSNRSRILPLVASWLFEPATKPAGVCSFLPDAARSRGQSKWPIKKSCSTDAIQSKDVQFHQEVNQVRDFLCQTSESENNKSPIDVSFQEAESIVEEV